MSISEATNAAIRGDIAAIRAIRMSLELLLTCEQFNTHDMRDELAMARTIAVFHRVERRIKLMQTLPENTRHAAIETLREFDLV